MGAILGTKVTAGLLGSSKNALHQQDGYRKNDEPFSPPFNIANPFLHTAD
jgi:hypothetical protein